MNIRKGWTLVKDAAGAWQEDYAASMGAALSYYTLFSIGPLLLIVIGIAGLVLGEEAARGAIMGELQGLMGTDGAQAIEAMIGSMNEPSKGIVATIVGVVTLIVGATTVFGELQSDLDRIWRAPTRDPVSGLWGLLRTRLLSFGMILGIAFLLMVSLVVSAAVSALGTLWGPLFGGWEILAQLLNVIVGFGISTVLFAMIYKLMPRAKVSWRDVWVGAAFTSLLFTVGRFLLGLYLGKSGVTSGFGAAGSLVLVMVWVYYSAQIFLLGAEFTWVYAHSYGSRRGEERPRAAQTTVDTATEQAQEQGAAAGVPPVAISGTPSFAAAPAVRATLKQRPFTAIAAAACAGLVMAFVTRGRGRRKLSRPAGAGSAA